MTELHSELRGIEALGQAHLLLSAAFAAFFKRGSAMNKKISLGLCISLIIIAVAATFAATMVVSKQIFSNIISNISQRSQTYESVDEISKIISKLPHLYQNERIVLGAVDADKLMLLDAPDMTELVINLIDYALLRDEYRVDVLNQMI